MFCCFTTCHCFIYISYPKTEASLNIQILFQVLYDVKKKGMMVPFKGERDACEELAKLSKKQDVADKLKQYKISKNCPINAVSSVYLVQVRAFVPIM